MPNRSIRSTRMPFVALALSALLACGNDPVPISNTTVGRPVAMTVVWPNRPSSAPAGSLIPGPSVSVRDANDRPVPGVIVVFAVLSGGGSLVGGTSVTDSQGMASSGSWQLGLTVGSQALTASSSGLPTWQMFMTATAP